MADQSPGRIAQVLQGFYFGVGFSVALTAISLFSIALIDLFPQESSTLRRTKTASSTPREAPLANFGAAEAYQDITLAFSKELKSLRAEVNRLRLAQTGKP